MHAALGEPTRLRMVDDLALGDRTFQELAAVAGVPGNVAAHHLRVLEASGLIGRRISEGDRRRRYISLRPEALAAVHGAPTAAPRVVLFVCTHNSARSQFAEALWRQRTGEDAASAGTHPADRVHPLAIAAARAFEVDLTGAAPKGYAGVDLEPDLVVTVCDRAHEAGLPFAAPSLHWSVPDPVRAETSSAFRAAFGEIAERIERLADTTQP